MTIKWLIIYFLFVYSDSLLIIVSWSEMITLKSLVEVLRDRIVMFGGSGGNSERMWNFIFKPGWPLGFWGKVCRDFRRDGSYFKWDMIELFEVSLRSSFLNIIFLFGICIISCINNSPQTQSTSRYNATTFHFIPIFYKLSFISINNLFQWRAIIVISFLSN